MIDARRSSWLVAGTVAVAMAGVAYAGPGCCSKGGGAKDDTQTTATAQCTADHKAKGSDHAKGQAKGADCKHGDAATTASGCGHKH